MSEVDGQAAPTDSKKGSGCLWLAAGACALFVVWAVVPLLFSSDPAPSIKWRVESSEFEVVNPASIRVFISVRNQGGGYGSPSCSVTASDPSGVYSGFDRITHSEVYGPGEVSNMVATVVVRNEGAVFVDDVQVDCSAS